MGLNKKTVIISFRTIKDIEKDIERILRETHYRNKTEIINEALRLFIDKYNTNSKIKNLKVKKR